MEKALWREAIRHEAGGLVYRRGPRRSPVYCARCGPGGWGESAANLLRESLEPIRQVRPPFPLVGKLCDE
jgi:hypothetical protein